MIIILTIIITLLAIGLGVSLALISPKFVDLYNDK